MIEVSDHGKVREIRLNRPPANAINRELCKAFSNALSNAASEADAVVVSGLPGMFSAGLDVPELLGLDRDRFSRYWQEFIGMLRIIALMPIPIVFAMTGHSPAGGIVMALFGDYRIMPRGKFKTGLNEARVGLVAPPVAHRALVRLIGAHAAERILVAGEMMDVEKALDLGLVDELADDPDAVVKRGIEWCEQHLALPPQSMLATRAMARADLHAIFDDSSQFGVEKFVRAWFQDSTQSTLRQMVERLRK